MKKYRYVLGIIFVWILISSFFYYDGSRYEISKYEGKYWLHDEKMAYSIEKDGQSLTWNRRYIYSYGKSGFIIIDKKNNNLKIMFDDRTSNVRKKDIFNEKQRYPHYIEVLNYCDLKENEKKVYDNLYNTYGSYKW